MQIKNNKDLKDKIKSEIKDKKCYLNPDASFTDELIDGLLVNEERYGYQSCPCRLAVNDEEKDRDIVCPCYYRDPDVAEFGNCYCALFVSKEVYEGKEKTKSIPERRPAKEIREKINKNDNKAKSNMKSYWLCTICGDIHYGIYPPKLCPTCEIEDVYVQISEEEAKKLLP